jgi:hypothetical protein
MAEEFPNPSERLRIDRRKLLASTAAISAAAPLDSALASESIAEQLKHIKASNADIS